MPRSKRLKASSPEKTAPIPPVAAARAVVTHTSEIISGSADKTEPPLNPNQPNQSRNTPIIASGAEEFGNVFDLPFSYLPRRGPSKITAASAAHPPTECTTVDPAKS